MILSFCRICIFNFVYGSLFMQPLLTTRKPLNIMVLCFMMVMCCMVVLFSSCTASLTDALNTPAPAPTQVVKPTATPSPVQAKTDSKGIATEAVQRAELARIQSIMAGMTLDQKLGQLII